MNYKNLSLEEAKELLRQERAACKTCAAHAECASSDHYFELTAYIAEKEKEQ